jgi:hypothetical protein
MAVTTRICIQQYKPIVNRILMIGNEQRSNKREYISSTHSQSGTAVMTESGLYVGF